MNMTTLPVRKTYWLVLGVSNLCLRWWYDVNWTSHIQWDWATSVVCMPIVI